MNDFKEILRSMLDKTAIDANGNVVQSDGEPVTYLQALCDQIIKKGFKDGALGWKILQEAGMVSRGNQEQKGMQHSAAMADYDASLARQKSKIKRLLKKTGTDDPAIDLQIELAARDWLAYERACTDYNAASASADTEELIRLSDQMRKWSATVRDDLTKLTMNVKDSERQAAQGPNNLDAFIEGMKTL